MACNPSLRSGLLEKRCKPGWSFAIEGGEACCELWEDSTAESPERSPLDWEDSWYELLVPKLALDRRRRSLMNDIVTGG